VGLKDFLNLFGYALKVPQGKVPAKLLQHITDWVRGRPEENLVNQVLLRTMRQAVYSEENHGHFGLAADYYCHFTSPIRRYPDLVVHRVLRALMANELNTKLRHKWEKWLPEAAKHSSERERVAMEAERETVDLKKAEYMSDKVGDTFTGIISGVGQFGFFVQLPTTVEGLVHVSTLTDDYYHFHEQFYALIGERTRRRFRLGDSVVVKLTSVDVDARKLDFVLEAEESPVITVAAVPSETRSRAAHKQALMGLPKPVEEAPEEVARNQKGRRRKPRGKGKTATEAVAPAVTAEPAKPVRVEATGPSRPVKQARQPLRVVSKEPQVQPESPKPSPERPRPHARRAAKVDMWGVPVPEGRARPRLDDDPTVSNPYSLVPAPRSESRAAAKAIAEAPFAPAPGTADESGGLPGTVDGGQVRRKKSARRPSRPRRAAAKETKE